MILHHCSDLQSYTDTIKAHTPKSQSQVMTTELLKNQMHASTPKFTRKDQPSTLIKAAKIPTLKFQRITNPRSHASRIKLAGNFIFKSEHIHTAAAQLASYAIEYSDPRKRQLRSRAESLKSPYAMPKTIPHLQRYKRKSQEVYGEM